MAQYQKETWMQLESKARNGRLSLMMAVILTAVNLLMLLLDEDLYFFFSLTVPYYAAVFGKGMDNGFTAGAWSENSIYTRTGLVMTLVILGLFLLCWIRSKENVRWLKAAAWLTVVDTVAYLGLSMVLSGNLDLVELLIHVFLIFTLFQAAKAYEELAQRRLNMTGAPVSGDEETPVEPWEQPAEEDLPNDAY